MSHKYEQVITNGDIAPEKVAPGVERKILAYCDELMCVENNFEKGGIGSMHNHPHTQITYVASGVFEFTIGDKQYTVRKGDTLLKQHGVMHGCTCVEAGVLVDFFTPMRKEFVGEK